MNDFVVKNSIQLGGSAKGNASDVTLGTGTYNLEVAAYDGVSFSVATQNTSPVGLSFNGNGTKMYMYGADGVVYQYTLSTSFDVSTASYDSVSFTTSGISGAANITFNSDGTKLYAVGFFNDSVIQYNLSTGFDLSTASASGNSFSVAAQNGSPRAILFSFDGTKMFIVGISGSANVYQYTLPTAFDITTASYSGVSFSVNGQEGTALGLSFSVDGTKMYVVGFDNNTVYQYNLSTGFDLSTASYSSVSFSVGGQDTLPIDVTFNFSGTKMYILGTTGDAVYQYSTGTSAALDLSTAYVFEVTPTAEVTLGFRYAPAAGNAKSFSVALTGADVGSSYDIANASYTTSSSSLQSVAPTPRGLAFKPDGTKMYVSSVDNEAVYQYSLSTAWDASTASYDSVSFSVSSQTAYPVEISFKLDGTEMYIASLFPASVFQYTLSTAWDISSASFTGSLSAAVNMDAILKSDGTKMFTLSGTTITSYTLSTAWDITSASSDAVTLSVSSQDGDTRALFVTPDGLKLFVVGSSTDTVYRYSLPSAWNLSGASYDNVSFSVASEDTLPFGLEFKTDGKVMYILGATGGVVDQYTSGTFSNATITYPSSVVWSGGTAPTTPADGVTDLLTFYTEDGGNTYYGFKVGEAMA